MAWLEPAEAAAVDPHALSVVLAKSTVSRGQHPNAAALVQIRRQVQIDAAGFKGPFRHSSGVPGVFRGIRED